jgi:two-component system cell cycle response regulator DivK
MLVLETFEPQLILMDLQLPGMNGLEFTRLLKQDPARRHISIVALTAYAMKGDEEKAIAAGCNGYLTKPIDTRSLPKSIAAYMNNSRDFEEAAAGKRAANET